MILDEVLPFVLDSVFLLQDPELALKLDELGIGRRALDLVKRHHVLDAGRRVRASAGDRAARSIDESSWNRGHGGDVGVGGLPGTSRGRLRGEALASGGGS